MSFSDVLVNCALVYGKAAWYPIRAQLPLLHLKHLPAEKCWYEGHRCATYGHLPLMESVKSLIARTWLHANRTLLASSMPSLMSVSGINALDSCDNVQPGCSLPLFLWMKCELKYFISSHEYAVQLTDKSQHDRKAPTCHSQESPTKRSSAHQYGWHRQTGNSIQHSHVIKKSHSENTTISHAHHRICRIESNLRRHALKVRFGWIQCGNASNVRHTFSGITGRVSAKWMSNDVHILGAESMIIAKLLY